MKFESAADSPSLCEVTARIITDLRTELEQRHLGLHEGERENLRLKERGKE